VRLLQAAAGPGHAEEDRGLAVAEAGGGAEGTQEAAGRIDGRNERADKEHEHVPRPAPRAGLVAVTAAAAAGGAAASAAADELGGQAALAVRLAGGSGEAEAEDEAAQRRVAEAAAREVPQNQRRLRCVVGREEAGERGVAD
jgi:hypothetical protein